MNGAAERDDIARQVKAASTSFYWAMRLLPQDRRDAIFAVYAFCRAVDDIADEPAPLPEKKAALEEWRREIGRLYEGAPTQPISRALDEARQRFGLRREDFLAIIDGMEMDADGPVIAPTWKEFDLYCDRVASAVGRLCVRIFGEPGEEGIAVAKHLGLALQTTNILRDVDEDARDGRLYLPRELLASHAIPWQEPSQVARHPAFPRAWRELAARADAHFRAAEQALKACDRRKMRPARIMMEGYRLNLERMRALNDAALADPAVSKRRVGKAEKLLIALRHAVF
ncbi:MAG: presqualene diphosphate synthase HpnD [Parvibaculaceae bacterium]